MEARRPLCLERGDLRLKGGAQRWRQGGKIGRVGSRRQGARSHRLDFKRTVRQLR
jgi:hypothetical protein